MNERIVVELIEAKVSKKLDVLNIKSLVSFRYHGWYHRNDYSENTLLRINWFYFCSPLNIWFISLK